MNIYLVAATWFTGAVLMFTLLFDRVSEANLIETKYRMVFLNWIFLLGFAILWPLTGCLVWHHRPNKK